MAEAKETQAQEEAATTPLCESAFVSFLKGEGERIELLLRTLHRLGHLHKRRRLVYEQMFLSGIQTLHVVILVGLVIGMIVSLQTGIELSKLGQQDQIGTIVAVSMAREMGPFITATILTATVGSAIAAELGTMSVSNELDALEVMSIDRLSLLVLPRLVGLALIAPLLTLVCDTVGIVGGAFVAQSQLNVGYEMYMTSAIDALRPTGLSLAPVRAAALPWRSMVQAACSTSSRAWSISLRLSAICCITSSDSRSLRGNGNHEPK